MYGKFSDSMRKVMQLANAAAAKLNHEYIGTEHVLLGIIEEGSLSSLFKRLQVDPKEIRQAVLRRTPKGPDEFPLMSRLPQTPRTKEVIEQAIPIAQAARSAVVDVSHVFLALFKQPSGVIAPDALREVGITPERAAAALGLTWEGQAEDPSVTVPGPEVKATDQAELSSERMGEIALLYLRARVRDEGLLLLRREKFHQRVGSIAEAIGISDEEALSFTQALTRELLEKDHSEGNEFGSLLPLPISL